MSEALLEVSHRGASVAESESGIPEPDEYAEGIAHPAPAAEASEFFERMATRPSP